MQVCPKCGEENPDRFRLCGICGEPLAAAAPPATRKTVTIVFTDLSGSTSLGERLDPETVRSILDRYFTEMRSVLERHGGRVEKYIGDAVMAVFGLPRLHEDDALRGVRAAMEMGEALAELNRDLERLWGITLTNRTGVNTGEVVAGDDSRDQRLVTGDAVNVAARLEQAAPEMGVLLGQSTWRLVKNAVDVEPVDPLLLKGKSEPVPAFRLIAVRSGEDVVRRLDTPMVGRVHELQSLLREFGWVVSERRCRVVSLLGHPGLGKTTLVRNFAKQVEGRARVLQGRCLPYGAGITFWPIAEVIRKAASIRNEDSLMMARAKLGALFEAQPEEAERLASTIGLSAEVFPIQETFWAARKLLEQLTREQALVVVFEDIHWAEPAMLELIEHMADMVENAPLLVLCLARPELLDEHPHWMEGRSNASNVVLEGLSEADSTVIVRNLLGGADLPPALQSRIMAAAEGNPLFVEQQLSMMFDVGLLKVDEDGHWISASDLTYTPVPPSISALLAARLDRLPRSERSLLEMGSVAGTVFYRSAVEELSPEGARELMAPNLAALIRKLLIRPTHSVLGHEDAFRFQHVLIRDTAYDNLLKTTRADLHERFAAWLERVAGSRLMEYEEIIGYHLEQAHRYVTEIAPLNERCGLLGQQAGRRLASAGRRALARGDAPAAANLLGRTVSLLPEADTFRLQVVSELSDALTEIGELNRAENIVGEAIEVASRLNDRHLVMILDMARLRSRYANHPDGWVTAVLRASEVALPVFEAAGDHGSLARAWRMLATAHGTLLHYGPAEEAARSAIHHARLAREVTLETRCFPALANCAMYGPTELQQAIALCERLLDDATGDTRAEAAVRGWLSLMYAMRGEFEKARDCYRRCRTSLEDLGSKLAASASSMTLGQVEMLAGEWARAELVLRADYLVLQQIGDRSFASTIAALVAEALNHQGRDEEALQFTELSAQGAAPDDVDAQFRWRCVRAKILARSGHAAEAKAMARAAVSLVRETDSPVNLGDALVAEAEVLQLDGQTPGAATSLGEAIELYRRKGALVPAERARAMLKALVPDPDCEVA